jgi:Transposase
MPMAVFGGIDWSEDHHDVAVVDADGRLVAKRRITDDAAGFGHLLGLLAEAGDSPDEPIPVAIETTRGLLVAWLRATGRPVYASNPMAVARYRQRHAVSGKQVRPRRCAGVGRHSAHRPGGPPAATGRLASWSARSRCFPRAQQDAVWDRTQAHNKLRSLLREDDPGFLAAFRDTRGGIMRPEARALLAAAPRQRRRPG